MENYKPATVMISGSIVKKGYIQLCSLSNMNKYDQGQFKSKLFIVRAVGKVDYAKYGLTHVPQLSPSPELFAKYNNLWKKNHFTDFEEETMHYGKTHSWWDLYCPAFIREISTDIKFRKCINRIMQYVDNGDNVMLVCFCGDVNICHRGIIGYFLRKKGYNVKFD